MSADLVARPSTPLPEAVESRVTRDEPLATEGEPAGQISLLADEEYQP